MTEKTISNEEYAHIKSIMPIACLDMVVFNKEHTHVLLGLRNNEPVKGEWWIPGGRILKGETYDHAIQRKAMEEIGTYVFVERKATFYEALFPLYHTSTVVFAVVPMNDVKPDSQHSKLKWFDISEIIKSQKIDERIKSVVEEACAK